MQNDKSIITIVSFVFFFIFNYSNGAGFHDKPHLLLLYSTVQIHFRPAAIYRKPSSVNNYALHT